MFDFSIYSAKSQYYDDSKKLVVGKIKDERSGVVINKFGGLKPKMNFFWQVIVVSIKKQNVGIKMLLQEKP